MSDDRPSALVVDASAALAIIRAEALGRPARSAISAHRSGGGRLCVPDHFWLELANVLVREYLGAGGDVIEAFREMDELGIESIRIDRPLLLSATDLQHRHRLSAYDAVYLALAEAEDARLLTLDLRLASAAGNRAVRLEGMLPPRLSEERAPYTGEPVDWARFGPYLARLRAQARDAAPAEPTS